MHGLIIGVEPIEQILAGQKVWEIRGKIALIKKGTKTVVGTADLVEVIGPLSLEEQRRHAAKHLPTPVEFEKGCYPTTYAWVLKNVKRLRKPVAYKHPSGAVIWVMLPEDLLK